jgi:hypothetical protein
MKFGTHSLGAPYVYIKSYLLDKEALQQEQTEFRLLVMHMQIAWLSKLYSKEQIENGTSCICGTYSCLLCIRKLDEGKVVTSFIMVLYEAILYIYTHTHDRLCGLVVRVPGYHIFWELLGPYRGPLSLVSTIEELLERKSGSDLENREYSHRDPLRWPRDPPFYPPKLHKLRRQEAVAQSI